MNLGASSISATTIGTGSGNTVQSQLEWLLLQIQNVVLNQIPDGTITMQKLATALANTINGNTSNIGDLATLTTTEKTNLVGAVNELVSQSAQIEQDLTDLTTDYEKDATQYSLTALSGYRIINTCTYQKNNGFVFVKGEIANATDTDIPLNNYIS